MRLDREDIVEHTIKISEAEAEEMWDELYRTATPADHPRLYGLYILLCERNLKAGGELNCRHGEYFAFCEECDPCELHDTHDCSECRD